MNRTPVASPERIEQVTNNGIHLVSLFIDYAYNLSFDFPTILRGAKMWKTNNAFKQAALALKREIGLLNGKFINCTLSEGAIDYIDNAADRFEKLLAADVQKLYYSHVLLYQRHGIEDYDLYAKTGTVSLMVGMLDMMIDKTMHVIFQEIGGNLRPKVNLKRLRAAFERLEVAMPKMAEIAKGDLDENIRRGMQVIIARMVDVDGSLINMFDPEDLNV